MTLRGVAPREGAWIEIFPSPMLVRSQWSRPVRARGLKCRSNGAHRKSRESRPVRARGLK